MADQSDQDNVNPQPSTNAQRTAWWATDKLLGAIIGGVLGGAGGAASVVWTAPDITESLNKMMPVVASIDRAQMYIQDALDDADIAKLRSDIRDVQRDLEYATQEFVVLLSDHREHAFEIEGVSRDVAQGYSDLSKLLEQRLLAEVAGLQRSTDAIKEKIVDEATRSQDEQKKTDDSLKRLGEQMEAIQKELAESREQLSNTLGEIIKHGNAVLRRHASQNDQDNRCGAIADEAGGDGKTAGDGTAAGDARPDHGCEAAMRHWMKRASYFVRSLEIPMETGVLKDTSVVKRDLRRAMRDFEQAASGEDAEGKREAVIAALAVVQSVRDLASTGRQY